MCWGSPGAGKLHAGKYEELTSSRQRGGGGWQSGQPPPYPLSEGFFSFMTRSVRAGPRTRMLTHAARQFVLMRRFFHNPKRQRGILLLHDPKRQAGPRTRMLTHAARQSVLKPALLS